MKKLDLDVCGFTGCNAEAKYRGVYLSPPGVKLARCDNHTGHHRFTEVREAGVWVGVNERGDG